MGLAAGTDYRFRIIPVSPAGAPQALPSSASVLSVTTPERLSNLDPLRVYKVSLPNSALTRGEAAFSGNGSASVSQGGFGDYTVLAESASAAVFALVSGQANITNFQGEQKSYTIQNGGPYKFGTTSALSDINGFDKRTADNQRLIALEDTTEWSDTPDADTDFDDFYWKADVATADISAQDLDEDKKEGTPNEFSPGAVVVVNENDSDNNNKPDSSDPDNLQESDPELVAVSLDWGSESLAGDSVTLSLTAGSDKVRIWYKKQDGTFAQAVNQTNTSKSWFIGSGEQPPSTVYVEGISASEEEQDVILRLRVASFTALAEDFLRLTVYRAQVDVDSKNDSGFTADPHTPGDAEDVLEGDTTKAGKVILVNDGDLDLDGVIDHSDGFNADGLMSVDDIPPTADQGQRFVPLVITLPEPIDLSKARLQIAYAASVPGSGTGGELRLWTKDGHQTRTKDAFTAASGTYVPAKTGTEYYTPDDLEELGLTDQSRSKTLFIEAITPSTALGDKIITIRVDPDGDGPAGFVAVDEVRLTAITMSFLENTNTAIDVSTEALNVSNWVTTDGLPTAAATAFATNITDPDNFRLQVSDLSATGATANVALTVIRGSSAVSNDTYTLNHKNGDQFRGNFMRLVSDSEDDAASGHGVAADPDKQTVLVQLGDELRMVYEPFPGYELVRTTQVGRPMSENDNGTNERKHDIREVKLNVVVFRNNAGAPSVTRSQVLTDIADANERFAQANIRVIGASINMGGAGDPGVIQPAALADGFTSGFGALTADETAVFRHRDGSVNTIDVFYVETLTNVGGRGRSYPAAFYAAAASRNSIVIGSASAGGSDPHNLAHEMMHILLNAAHRTSEPATAVFRGGTTRSKSVTGTKRIGPYPDATAAGVGTDDVRDIRANAEILP